MTYSDITRAGARNIECCINKWELRWAGFIEILCEDIAVTKVAAIPEAHIASARHNLPSNRQVCLRTGEGHLRS
jgi:hypothetical protein